MKKIKFNDNAEHLARESATEEVFEQLTNAGYKGIKYPIVRFSLPTSNYGRVMEEFRESVSIVAQGVEVYTRPDGSYDFAIKCQFLLPKQ